MHCIFYHSIVYFVKSTLKIHAFQITQYFEFLLIKSISFIVLTQFFDFNELLTIFNSVEDLKLHSVRF